MNRYVVAQLGSRMHYAVPRIFQQSGMLEQFFTDICAVKGWPRMLNAIPNPLRPEGLKRLMGRVPQGVPPKNITAFTSFGREYAKRRAQATSPDESTAAHLWAGTTFCELIIKNGIGETQGIYTFNSAGMELMDHARRQGIRTMMEQTIAPFRIEREIMGMEAERYPGWEKPAVFSITQSDFAAREEMEWQLADLIICGSQFVADGIEHIGGPVERCVVVPYGVDTVSGVSQRSGHSGPLRILTVGAVGLRKGSPDVLAAAKLLKGKAEFRMVGTIGVLPGAEKELRNDLELTGSIPRSEMAAQFAWADVFLLPSLYEGSATVVYEALAAGLPVVCTHNTGSVITDGEGGYLVPLRSPEVIAARLEQLASDPELLRHMSLTARHIADEYTVNKYGERLLAAVTGGDSKS